VRNIRPGSHVSEDEDEDAVRQYPHPGTWWDPAKKNSWVFRKDNVRNESGTDALGSRTGSLILTPRSVLLGWQGAAYHGRQS
jgi:hypothetical protein